MSSRRPRLFFFFGFLAFFALRPCLPAAAGATCGGQRRGLFGGGHGDLCRVVQTQGQLIAVDAQLHGVAHGCQLYQRDLRPGDQTHIQKMLPQCACTAHSIHNGAFSDL